MAILTGLVVSLLVFGSAHAQNKSDQIDSGVGAIINSVYVIPSSYVADEYTLSVSQGTESRLDASTASGSSVGIPFGSHVISYEMASNKNLMVATQRGLYFDNLSDGLDNQLNETDNKLPTDTFILGAFQVPVPNSNRHLTCLAVYVVDKNTGYSGQITGMLVNLEKKTATRAQECTSKMDIARYGQVAGQMFNYFYPQPTVQPTAEATASG